jgi:hypothetical protein
MFYCGEGGRGWWVGSLEVVSDWVIGEEEMRGIVG